MAACSDMLIPLKHTAAVALTCRSRASCRRQLVPDSGSNNYPSTFNPTTNIEGFDLSTASTVKLEVFDMLRSQRGRVGRQRIPSGRHTATFDLNNMSSGMYFYQPTSGPKPSRAK
ncbi:MAG: T9SS type A sorting domain-containing protein [bacterium]|nr:T9SS type A sorting domain-containing protein [bacterium]